VPGSLISAQTDKQTHIHKSTNIIGPQNGSPSPSATNVVAGVLIIRFSKY